MVKNFFEIIFLNFVVLLCCMPKLVKQDPVNLMLIEKDKAPLTP